MPEAFIEWLGTACSGPDRLGGKGAGLDRLARLGLPTPPGFCLTTSAHRAYLGDEGRLRMLRQIGRLPAEAARRELMWLAHRYPMPGPVAAALDDALDRLPARAPLAVRSSAVGEDGESASFAGLHESRLGVPRDGVASAVRVCWASLWSPAAVAYRVRRRFPFEGALMAVVVQALVPAEASAVAFTRNPISGQDEIVMNAARGFGEPIVSGRETPETVVLDKATLRVRRAGAGSVVADERARGSTGLAVGAARLAALGALCCEAEERLGHPVDIEAAFAGGRWLLVQARPITAGREGALP